MKLLRSTTLLLIALLLLPHPGRAQTSNPYTLPLLVKLLEGGFSGAEVLRRVRAACISFRINAAAEAELRKAGADDALLRELPSVCNHSVPAAQAPARGILSIIGELPPGWQRIVNQLPPSPNRQVELTADRQATIVVTAPGWCPDRTEVTLAPGDTVPWAPTLRARPWVGGCK